MALTPPRRHEAEPVEPLGSTFTDDLDSDSAPDADASLGPHDDVSEATEPTERWSPDDVLPLVAGATAIVALLSGQAPTGNDIADIVLTAAFAAGVVWLGRRGGSRTLVVSAALALVASGLSMPAVIFAGLALVGSQVLSQVGLDAPKRQVLKMVVAGLIVCSVMYLPNLGFDASASLLAAVVVVPIVVAGLRSLRDDERTVARRALFAAGGFVIAAVALTGLAALWSQQSVLDAIDDADAGITALEAGDQAGALALLQRSQGGFATASSRLGGPLTWPARVVPLVAQHARALETAAEQGEALAATAVRTVTTADVEAIRGQSGSLDLELITDVNRELATAHEVLRRAQQRIGAVRTPWLVPPLDDRLAEVEGELFDLVDDIDLAYHATSVVPGIFGAHQSRTYLVLFVQPAEAREYGGFVGAYGLLQADNGRLSLLESGSIDSELGTGEAEFTEPGAFPEGYFDQAPYRFPQNLTATADLSTIAAAARDLVPQWRQDPDFVLDGVITIDPYALGGLLELTGPIQVSGRTEAIDASNVVDFLLRGQYAEFDADARTDRHDALRELAGVAFGRLLTIDLPGPERLGAVFGPLARADRIAFTTFDDAENTFMRRIFLDADLPVVGDAVEMLGLYTQTAVAGKLDAYTTRLLNYVVDVDPATGQVQGTMTVTIRNDAPADAGPYVLGHIATVGLDGEELPVGQNLVGLYVYTRSDVSDVSSPDAPLRIDEVLPAFSYDRHELVTEVPLGGSATVKFDTSTTVEPGRYDLVVMAQAVAEIGELRVTVRPAPGWRVSGDGVEPDGSLVMTTPLDRHVTLSTSFERSD